MEGLQKQSHAPAGSDSQQSNVGVPPAGSACFAAARAALACLQAQVRRALMTQKSPSLSRSKKAKCLWVIWKAKKKKKGALRKEEMRWKAVSTRALATLAGFHCSISSMTLVASVLSMLLHCGISDAKIMGAISDWQLRTWCAERLLSREALEHWISASCAAEPASRGSSGRLLCFKGG